MSNSWRSVLIGSESLLMQCGPMLEAAGHQIVAVVTTRPVIRRWAAARGIRVIADPAGLLAAPDLQPFDYLFSITNLSVLPAEVIALPTRAAINFHDGPLPEYAGLNTPIWAMLNGEAGHGITWHLMTNAIDQGDILVERRFALSEGETALTLNTKCFEAGMQSFEDVVQGITSGELRGRPQSQALQPGQLTQPVNHYYGRKDRPVAACAIRWDQPAEQVATLVRALDFGTYANPIGSAKASFGGQLVIVPTLRVTEVASTQAPGTIVTIDAGGVVVATADLDVELTRLDTLDGKPRPLDCPVLGLRAGARFDVLDDPFAQQLTALNASLAPHETFWLRRLESQSPLELPYIDRSAAPTATLWQHLDAELPARGHGVSADGRVASLVAYLARLTDKDGFDLGFTDPALRRVAGAAPAWFAQQALLRIALDFPRGFDALRDTVAAELRELRKRVTCATDLVARSPELRTIAAVRDPRVQPVALAIVDTLDDAQALEGSELTLALTADGTRTRWIFDAAKLTREQVGAMQQHAATLMLASEADPSRPVAELPLWGAAERAKVLEQWNATEAPVRTDACVHRLFEEQASRTPGATAVTCEDRSLTYDELNRRANQLARRLKSLGVGPDVLVGLCMERSVEMMVALVAIHKAGGAYVPLDPAYPKDRIAYMVEDAKVPVLLTQDRVHLPRHSAKVVKLDTDWPAIATESADPFDGGAEPKHLAYVIYTSGSTGKPKGVMVEHRNVVNFFAGMDHHLGTDEAGTWVAVTSLSFDISVLELCWTLARGFHVVIATGEERAGTVQRGAHAARPLDFSLFYFASDESEAVTDKYKLLLEGAKYGDQHGFEAVWTPERHFHAFGGLYPNPAVAGAAIAAVTERIKIRAGSVVLPLHHPLRVAEEWSVVDNISRGRVGISFASGWQPNDFVLKPENFADNKNVMLRNIEVVRRLWRGEKCSFPGATGHDVEVGILPRPVQKELAFWVTSAGNPETFIAAGKLGANVLTHLLGQTVEELDGKLAAYRQAWKDAGHAGEGHVTLMLHTFVGPDEAAVREKVRQPLIDYLKSSLNLVKQYAWSFPAFKKRAGMDDANSTASVDLQSLDDEEMQGLLEHSFNRYYETSGLFGTPEGCLKQVDAIKAIGVDEVACLIDFGVDSPSVLAHMEYLNEVRKQATPRSVPVADHSIPTLLSRHAATHLQCTPSMARMLLLDPAATKGMAGLKRMMVGGEALQPSLARELRGAISADGALMNMYGPTETTIWSSVHRVDRVEGIVPLGKPLANQAIYILDTRQQPTPVGVPGELAIGGKGVVRGYLNRPELTAERFLPHPFQGAAGGRVYRTGDLARLRDDGTLEFLGRLDHQVKVRGYRIELGEIESSLLTHTGVREAVVIAREDTPGDVRLVAYLVPAAADAVPAAELKEHLRSRLPDYMVPSHFVLLEALPQTPNGKIDRKQLPAPEAGLAPAAGEAFVPPASDLEQQIAAIWKDVLKLPEVGTRDNFFDLGGHSLLAVQAHRKLRDTLQRDLSITDIFRFPTIQSLSAYLGGEGAQGAAAQQGQDRGAGRRAAMARRQRTPA